MAYVSKIDRTQRRQKTGEDFTPRALVDRMLDKLPPESFKEKLNFLDNSAGNGNIIIAVIERKLDGGLSYIDALKSTYAVELMEDNVMEMKERIFNLIYSRFPDADKKKVEKIVNHNIVCSDAFEWDYDNWKSKKVVQLSLFGT